MGIKKHLYGIMFGLALTLYTVYVLLDAFVIVRVYTEIPGSNVQVTTSVTPEVTSPSQGSNNTAGEETVEKEPSEPVITENSYIDDNISITISEYHEYDTNIYVADIKLSSPEFLKTALAKNTYGKNVKEETSVIAKNNNAILAINGDYFGARERGYVLRNGVLYRDLPATDREALVIYDDGSFEIVLEKAVSAANLYRNGAQQIFSFGPGLIEDGKIVIDEDEEARKADQDNPRTAIAIVGEGHYLFVVADGRTDESEGVNLFDLADFMLGLGAVTAYNLDGGGSSALYFNGKIINVPISGGKKNNERSVSDIVYIGY